MFDLSRRVEILKLDMIELPYYAYYYRMRSGSICHSNSSLFLPIIENLDVIYKESDTKQKRDIAFKMKNYQIYSFCLYMFVNKKKDNLTYDIYFDKYFNILRNVRYSDIYWKRFTDTINFLRLELFKKTPSIYCSIFALFFKIQA
jgi:hypothetical protein